MRRREPTEWVVYKAAMEKNLGGQNAICSQEEWEVLEASLPGYHTLIRDHIGNEAEAEQLARALQTPPPVPKVIKPSAQTLRKQAERVARLAAMAQTANGPKANADDDDDEDPVDELAVETPSTPPRSGEGI